MKKKIIIVGGGTAGSVIGSKLSDFYDITIFDRSTQKNLPFFYRIPLLVGLLYNKKNKFISKKLIELNAQRSIPFFVPNVLGGSSVINGCVHVIGINSKWRNLLDKFFIQFESYLNSYNRLYTWNNEKGKINLREARQSNLDSAFIHSINTYGVCNG